MFVSSVHLTKGLSFGLSDDLDVFSFVRPRPRCLTLNKMPKPPYTPPSPAASCSCESESSPLHRQRSAAPQLFTIITTSGTIRHPGTKYRFFQPMYFCTPAVKPHCIVIRERNCDSGMNFLKFINLENFIQAKTFPNWQLRKCTSAILWTSKLS